ncbi:MAG TPA: DNA polymerase III subunit delta' [Rhodocyclaceae bacterium]|nr:DNA polymerase III subunit delta' [Rhodocyclaceae bacterium]
MQVSVNKIHDWNIPVWQNLLERIDTLSHGLLFTGVAGIGKVQFAEQFAAWLLCESASKNTAAAACGHCTSCQLLSSGNHPDIRLVTLDEEEESEEGETKSKSKKASTQIKIDQIRALEDFVFVGSHRSGARIALIHPAEAMNLAAANSLLKMLEEPPPNVYFILVSSNLRRLLPTLLSRCRKVTFGLPDHDIAAAWLKAQGVKNPEKLLPLVGGAPLAAALWAEEGLDSQYAKAAESFAENNDVVTLAGKWLSGLSGKSGAWRTEHLTDALQKWLYDLQRVQLGEAPRYFASALPALQSLARQANPSRLARGYADVSKIRATVNHPLNAQLMLEDMAGRYLAAVAPAAK